ncbi:hypothetical protein [Aliarcobacter butzleri]|uniref:hypothetical protein n=1 Tax=Aliarcobacter butzleri TaxID=28197 RepID=UPI002B250AA1|nr:hypothetical protein [Aliarcobacter butzleri]
MNNLYDLLVISIKNIEVECDKYKSKEDYLLKKRLLKDILTHLHEIRRQVHENLNEKEKNNI